MEFHHVNQDGLDDPRDPPTSASQSAGITGLSHCARPLFSFFNLQVNHSLSVTTVEHKVGIVDKMKLRNASGN